MTTHSFTEFVKQIKRNPLFVFRIPVLLAINVYQILFSFDHGIPGKAFPGYRVCRHWPSCSEYGYEVIYRFGLFVGGFLAIKRVISCGPWTPANTWDPVPEKL